MECDGELVTTRTPLPSNALFTCAVPPAESSAPLGTNLILPELTADLVESRRYLYSIHGTTNIAPACRGAPLGADTRHRCVGELVDGWSEHDRLPMVVLPAEESRAAFPDQLASRGMCVLCMRYVAETNMDQPPMHISPVGVIGGYAAAHIRPSAYGGIRTTAPFPIPKVCLSLLHWVTTPVTGERRVDESALWAIPESTDPTHKPIVSKHAYTLDRLIQERNITQQSAIYIGIFSSNESVARMLASILCDNGNLAWLTDDISTCTGVEIPEAEGRIHPLLPWTPSSHRPLQQLLGARISYLFALTETLHERIGAPGATHLDHFMLQLVMRYMDMHIATAVQVLRDPSLYTVNDLPQHMHPLRQPVMHEQIVHTFIETAKQTSDLYLFVQVIRGILPVSHKISNVCELLGEVVRENATDALVLTLCLRMVLLWSMNRHGEFDASMGLCSLRMRHAVLSMPLEDMLAVLGWKPGLKASRPLPFELAARVLWLRLVTMPGEHRHIGLMNPTLLIPEYAGTIYDVRTDLINMCREFSLLREHVDSFCRETSRLVSSALHGHFYCILEGNLPTFAGVHLVLKKKPKTSREGSARQGISTPLPSIASVLRAMKLQGVRPSENIKDAQGAGGLQEPPSSARRMPNQPPMNKIYHQHIISLVKRLPTYKISIVALRHLGLSPLALETLSTLIREHDGLPMFANDFTSACKAIIRARENETPDSRGKRQRSRAGRRDIALLILYVGWLLRMQMITVQDLHPSTAEQQQAFFDRHFAYTYPGVRTMPVCPDCNVMLGVPSGKKPVDKSAETARAAAPEPAAQPSSTGGKQRRVRSSRKQNASKEQQIPDCNARRVRSSNEKLSAAFDAEALLEGDVLRMCPNCGRQVFAEAGTFIDMVGRIAECALLTDRDQRLLITLCINCCTSTQALDSLRHGYGYCCVECAPIVNAVTPVCKYTDVAHQPRSTKFIALPRNVGGAGGMRYEFVCASCYAERGDEPS